MTMAHEFFREAPEQSRNECVQFPEGFESLKSVSS